jgi:hypothetical protein
MHLHTTCAIQTTEPRHPDILCNKKLEGIDKQAFDWKPAVVHMVTEKEMAQASQKNMP